MDTTKATQQQTLPLEPPVADDHTELTLREAMAVRGGSLAVKTGVRAGQDMGKVRATYNNQVIA